MNKLHHILFILTLSLVSLSSCNYLDIVPDEKANENDAFADRNAAKRFLYSCYAYMPQARHGSASLDLMTADEVVTAFEHETFARFPKGTYSASDPVISYWNSLFLGIKQCYLLINNIDKVPELDKNLKADYIGQANFLIAYYHFLLCQSYGPIILVKEEPSVNTPADSYLPRSPYDECVDFITKKFDEAAKQLPKKRTNDNFGLATSVAAKALKAKMLLYAASPLFNGNKEFYANFKDHKGKPLMPLTYDANKWVKARNAYKEAIAAAEEAGHSLYMSTNFNLDGYNNTEPKNPIQHRLRYTILQTANPEIIWSDSRDEGPYGIQNKTLPFNGNWSWNGIAPTMAMLKRFYTDKGLPIDEDPDFPKGKNIYNITTIADSDSIHGDPGSKTILFNMHREPRFYAWIGFQGGFFEIMSSTDGNGGYKDDASYKKYNTDENTGKLVLNFIKGGNAARNDRTNNYAPSAYLNKKGIVPGYHVSTNSGSAPFYAWPIIRLADLYLGYAEACVETGDLETAKEYLNKVRTRAGIPTVEQSWKGIAELNQNKLRQIVRQERMIEMYFENQTFWDLRRWKMADKYLGSRPHGLNMDAKNIEDLAKDTEIQFERKFESPTNYLMPIPVDDVKRNTKIVQNPGY